MAAMVSGVATVLLVTACAPARGAVPGGVGNHFWFAWAAFEPNTRIWTADE